MIPTSLLIAASLSLAPPADDGPAPEAIRAAIEKALPPIVKATEEYRVHRDCFSCHHQAVPALALTIARGRGFTVEDDTLEAMAELTEGDLRTALDAYKKGTGQGGGATRAGYALLMLEVAGRKGDDLTEAVAGYLLARDTDRGAWRPSSNRPPSEASEFTTTYVALRALGVFAGKDSAETLSKRKDKARRWLEAAKPKDTEDRAFRLLGLKAASASDEVLHAAADDLLKTRRDDGGWAQREGDPADAYATGSALFALHTAGGLKADDPAYRKGLAFLIGSQRKDGTWFVASRSKPFQPYFESSFPYGKDQFISMAASSWALAALALGVR